LSPSVHILSRKLRGKAGIPRRDQFPLEDPREDVGVVELKVKGHGSSADFVNAPVSVAIIRT